MSESRFRRGAIRVVFLVCVLAVSSLARADDDVLVPRSVRPPTLSLNPVAESPRPKPRPASGEAVATGDEAMPLRRPSSSPGRRPEAGVLTSSVWKTAVMLGVVCLGLFVVARLIGRGRRGLFSGGLPAEVIEVLGRARLDTRHSIQLVRCGSRVLVLSTDGSGTLSTLAEISDPDEVNLLVDLCRPRRHPVDGGEAAESSYGGSTSEGAVITEPVHA